MTTSARVKGPGDSYTRGGGIRKKTSVNRICMRLGHESLDVALAYLKSKDAESEEAQKHANSGSLALFA